eukprot:scaffold54920_cov33-Tisochrysis_lutea.AAC.4
MRLGACTEKFGSLSAPMGHMPYLRNTSAALSTWKLWLCPSILQLNAWPSRRLCVFWFSLPSSLKNEESRWQSPLWITRRTSLMQRVSLRRASTVRESALHAAIARASGTGGGGTIRLVSLSHGTGSLEGLRSHPGCGSDAAQGAVFGGVLGGADEPVGCVGGVGIASTEDVCLLALSCSCG